MENTLPECIDTKAQVTICVEFSMKLYFWIYSIWTKLKAKILGGCSSDVFVNFHSILSRLIVIDINSNHKNRLQTFFLVWIPMLATNCLPKNFTSKQRFLEFYMYKVGQNMPVRYWMQMVCWIFSWSFAQQSVPKFLIIVKLFRTYHSFPVTHLWQNNE